MAVLIEATSVVIRGEALMVFPEGWDGFKSIVPNDTLCADTEIVCVRFMVPADVKLFIKNLEMNGLIFLRENESIDIAVVDQLSGPTTKCEWLEFGHLNISGDEYKVAACRLKGSELVELFTPPDWVYEKSLSSSSGFVPNEHVEKVLQYLRTENGLDVYLNRITGEEVYASRTDKS